MTETRDLDWTMMGLALQAAKRGDPSPNPHVGAVIVRDQELIATGHHERAGLAHAEVAAIENAREDVRGATLYVTFEPCNHFGRTGPCTEAILRAGISRVVVGCKDPAPHVPGASEKLREAGVQVDFGVREEEATRLVADFTKHVTTGLPYVRLKGAMTLDGRIADRFAQSKWITSELARKEAHRMRDRSDAVMVGVGTVLADDPLLTVRHVEGRDPVRVVLDSQLRTPLSSKIIQHTSAAPTLVFHALNASSTQRENFKVRGVELIEVASGGHGGVALFSVLQELGRRGIVRLLVEGGAHVHGAFLDEGFFDAASIFISPKILADDRALPFALSSTARRLQDAYRFTCVTTRSIGSDILWEGDVARDVCSQD